MKQYAKKRETFLDNACINVLYHLNMLNNFGADGYHCYGITQEYYAYASKMFSDIKNKEPNYKCICKRMRQILIKGGCIKYKPITLWEQYDTMSPKQRTKWNKTHIMFALVYGAFHQDVFWEAWTFKNVAKSDIYDSLLGRACEVYIKEINTRNINDDAYQKAIALIDAMDKIICSDICRSVVLRTKENPLLIQSHTQFFDQLTAEDLMDKQNPELQEAMRQHNILKEQLKTILFKQ